MKKYKKVISHNVNFDKKKKEIKYNAYETFIRGVVLVNTQT